MNMVFLELGINIKIWVRDKIVAVVHEKLDSIAKLFQSLRDVFKLKIGVAIQKVLLT